MSGSGGGGTWVDERPSSCDSLSVITTLNSPDKDVLKGIKPKDVLDITVVTLNNAVVVKALHRGKVAGSITATIVQKLAECVEEGYTYVADVIDIEGGACKIRAANSRFAGWSTIAHRPQDDPLCLRLTGQTYHLPPTQSRLE